MLLSGAHAIVMNAFDPATWTERAAAIGMAPLVVESWKCRSGESAEIETGLFLRANMTDFEERSRLNMELHGDDGKNERNLSVVNDCLLSIGRFVRPG